MPQLSTPISQSSNFSIFSNSQNNSIDNIMNTKYFTTMKLQPARKEPTGEFSKNEKRTRFINKHLWKNLNLKQLFELQMKENRGILCGKLSNIVVVDLDFYDKHKKGKDIIFDRENNLFLKDFGNDYVNKFNTLTFKTANGGEHLIFNYTPKIRTTSNDELNIDIRGDDSYIVAPGSVIDKSRYNKSIKKNKKGFYTILHDTEIKDMPIELETWLSLNLYNKHKKKVTRPIKKNKDGLTEQIEPYEQDEVDLTEYTYTWTDDILIKILDGLPDSYFIDNVSWYVFTTAMKTIDREDLWDKYSKEKGGDKYDKDENIKRFWNNAKHQTYMCLEHLLDNSSFVDDPKLFLSYFKLKMTDIHNTEPDEYIDEKYIDKNSDGMFIMNKCDKRFNFCKADTGTGKTTAFKNYIKLTEKRFISVVSRVSLGKEQVKVFKDAGIECHWHEDIKDCWYEYEGSNIVVTIDSIMKMGHWHDFNDYIIYLDEYNSLVEYFVDCPNLCNKRIIVWKYLNSMLDSADKVIMTDADISDNSINFIKDIAEPNEMKYICNKYKHNNNKEATELFSYNELIELISKQDKAMICLDSKNVGEKLCIDMKDKYDIDIKYYSSDTLEDIDLDAHKFVAFSPKIVYGLDSLMERPVFCYYKCHTISPVAMVQQVNRNRKITHLYYLFESKTWKAYKYDTIEEVEEEIKNGVKMVKDNFSIIGDDNDSDRFNKLLASFRYTLDCYNTNKFAHFQYIIQQRGFKITNFMDFNKDSIQKSGGFLTKLKQELQELKECEILEHWDKVVDEYNTYVRVQSSRYECEYRNLILLADFYPEKLKDKWCELEDDESNNYLEDCHVDYEEIVKGYSYVQQSPLISYYNEHNDDTRPDMPNYHNYIYYREQLYDTMVTNNIEKCKSVLRDSVLQSLPETYQKIISLLNMPFELIGDSKYNELLRDPISLERYYKCIHWIEKCDGQLHHEIKENMDFNSQKYKSFNSQLIYLNKLCESSGFTLGEKTPSFTDEELELIRTRVPDAQQKYTQLITLMNQPTKEVNEKLQKEYCIIFRCRSKKLDFNLSQHRKQTIVKIYKQLFGEIIETQQTSTIKNKKTIKVTKYFLDHGYLDKVKNIRKWRYPDATFSHTLEKDYGQ